jgi:hypothetical protein
MFDPPVEIELKEVLKQVETEHHAAVRARFVPPYRKFCLFVHVFAIMAGEKKHHQR